MTSVPEQQDEQHQSRERNGDDSKNARRDEDSRNVEGVNSAEEEPPAGHSHRVENVDQQERCLRARLHAALLLTGEALTSVKSPSRKLRSLHCLWCRIVSYDMACSRQ